MWTSVLGKVHDYILANILKFLLHVTVKMDIVMALNVHSIVEYNFENN